MQPHKVCRGEAPNLSNLNYVAELARRVDQASGSDPPVVAAVLELFYRTHPPQPA